MIRAAALFVVSALVLFAAVFFFERTFSPVFQSCIEKNENTDGKPAAEKQITAGTVVYWNVRCTGDFLEANNPIISALATVVIAAFTFTLWTATHRQAELTKEALIADKRAFVCFKGINGFWEKDEKAGHYSWRFRPTLENTGDTPTVKLTLYTSCELRNSALPQDFQFADNGHIGTGLIGPKQGTSGSLAPLPPNAAIGPQDLLDVQLGKKFLYLWGWARYNDVFPRTVQHVTRFAWAVTVTGDPFAYDPKITPANLAFGNLYLSRGNCADDECRLQGLS